MALKIIRSLKVFKIQETILSPPAPLSLIRHTTSKHWLPKWRKLRAAKVQKIELPDFRENPDDLTEEQIRSKLKEKGLIPRRPWIEKPFFISNTGSVFEAYVPPEGDGKISSIQMQGAKQKLQFLEKKSKSMMAVRKIRGYEEDFETQKFCEHAQDIYIKMHECLSKQDLDNLIIYATERAYPELIHNINRKTIRWSFIKNVELPRVVHARCTDIVTQENVFGQITVRFHTQQKLAIYDRFGRLMHGSEILAKDVLEYVVFEKHLANEYGTWRVHAKIIPDWLPPKEPSIATYVRPKASEPEPAVETAVTQTTENEQVSGPEPSKIEA